MCICVLRLWSTALRTPRAAAFREASSTGPPWGKPVCGSISRRTRLLSCGLANQPATNAPPGPSRSTSRVESTVQACRERCRLCFLRPNHGMCFIAVPSCLYLCSRHQSITDVKCEICKRAPPILDLCCGAILHAQLFVPYVPAGIQGSFQLCFSLIDYGAKRYPKILRVCLVEDSRAVALRQLKSVFFSKNMPKPPSIGG